MAENPIYVTVGAWADRTFPDQTNERLIRHLEEEVGELRESINGTNGHAMPEEIGDCLILLYALAYRLGLDADWLVRNKHKINEQRQWRFDPEYGYDKKIKAAS